MRRLFLGRKGQSTLEYAVLIAIVAAGLILMSAFVRRGYMGKLRSSTEQVGDQFEPGTTEYDYEVQADPVTASNVVNEEGNITSTRTGGGSTVKEDRTYTPWEK